MCIYIYRIIYIYIHGIETNSCLLMDQTNSRTQVVRIWNLISQKLFQCSIRHGHQMFPAQPLTWGAASEAHICKQLGTYADDLHFLRSFSACKSGCVFHGCLASIYAIQVCLIKLNIMINPVECHGCLGRCSASHILSMSQGRLCERPCFTAAQVVFTGQTSS